MSQSPLVMKAPGPLSWLSTASGDPGHAEPETAPMVLLHGFTGAPASWAPVIAALPRPRRALAVALPGHHPAMPVAHGFVANVDRVAALVAAADHEHDRHAHEAITPCHLIGYSLGARVALGLAARHPALVQRLTLLSVHPGLDSDAARAERAAADRRHARLLRERGLAAFVDTWQEQPVLSTAGRVPAQALERQRRVRMQHDAESLAQSLEHMGLAAMPDYRDALRALPMPVTLVAGALDHKFTSLARALAHATPALELVILDHCGHNPLLERPGALAAILT